MTWWLATLPWTLARRLELLQAPAPRLRLVAMLPSLRAPAARVAMPLLPQAMANRPLAALCASLADEVVCLAREARSPLPPGQALALSQVVPSLSLPAAAGQVALVVQCRLRRGLARSVAQFELRHRMRRLPVMWS